MNWPSFIPAVACLLIAARLYLEARRMLHDAIDECDAAEAFLDEARRLREDRPW